MRSTEELRASIELAKAASPGPWWETDDSFAMMDTRVYPGPPPTADCVCTMQVSNCPNFRNDRRFIADAGTHRLTDLADLLATREEVERLRKALTGIASRADAVEVVGSIAIAEMARQALKGVTP